MRLTSHCVLFELVFHTASQTFGTGPVNLHNCSVQPPQHLTISCWEDMSVTMKWPEKKYRKYVKRKSKSAIESGYYQIQVITTDSQSVM